MNGRTNCSTQRKSKNTVECRFFINPNPKEVWYNNLSNTDQFKNSALNDVCSPYQVISYYILGAVEIVQKSPQSKTGKLLNEVFENDEVITSYLAAREKYKQNQIVHKDLFKYWTGQLKDKLKLRKREIENELEEMEIGLLSEESISVKFQNQKEKNIYEKLKNQLLIVSCLGKNLIK